MILEPTQEWHEAARTGGDRRLESCLMVVPALLSWVFLFPFGAYLMTLEPDRGDTLLAYVILGVFALLYFCVAAGGLPHRPRRGLPTLTTVAGAAPDAAPSPATVFALDRRGPRRRRYWMLSVLVPHALACLVSMVWLRPEHDRGTNNAGLLLGVIDLLAIAWLVRPRPPVRFPPADPPHESLPQDLALTAEGVLVGAQPLVAWHTVQHVEATIRTFHRRKEPDLHQPCVDLTLGPSRHQLQHPPLRIRLDEHEQHPLAILRAIHHYAEHPEHRHELGDGSSLDRIRELAGDFVEPPRPQSPGAPRIGGRPRRP